MSLGASAPPQGLPWKPGNAAMGITIMKIRKYELS